MQLLIADSFDIDFDNTQQLQTVSAENFNTYSSDETFTRTTEVFATINADSFNATVDDFLQQKFCNNYR